jgi:hypothetical protein
VLPLAPGGCEQWIAICPSEILAAGLLTHSIVLAIAASIASVRVAQTQPMMRRYRGFIE